MRVKVRAEKRLAWLREDKEGGCGEALLDTGRMGVGETHPGGFVSQGGNVRHSILWVCSPEGEGKEKNKTAI